VARVPAKRSQPSTVSRRRAAASAAAAEQAPAEQTATTEESAAPSAAPQSSRTATPSAAPSAAPQSSRTASAPPAGSIDLAGDLKTLLDTVRVEVEAVSALSEQIDELVTELNAVRQEQATRLLVLDDLRGSVGDDTLGTFLNQTIQPRTVRVQEVVPERLTRD
jgi:chemotaxis protein histidine kinase CheA